MANTERRTGKFTAAPILRQKVYIEKTLVEVVRKPGSHERRKVIDGFSGLDLTSSAVGGVWVDPKDKPRCPECHGCHTRVYLSFYDVEFSGFSRAGGEMEGLGNLTISCMDCKKDFDFSSCHDLPFDFIQSVTFEDRKKFRKQEEQLEKLTQALPRKNIGEV